MDYAPIAIDRESGSTTIRAEMPEFGTQDFDVFFCEGNVFIKYGDYPMVKACVGADLLAGSSCPYELWILEAENGESYITEDNCESFFIAMEHRKKQ